MGKEYLSEITLRRIVMLPDDVVEAQAIMQSLLGGLDLNRFSTEEPTLRLLTRKEKPDVQAPAKSGKIHKFPGSAEDNGQA